MCVIETGEGDAAFVKASAAGSIAIGEDRESDPSSETQGEAQTVDGQLK